MLKQKVKPIGVSFNLQRSKYKASASDMGEENEFLYAAETIISYCLHYFYNTKKNCFFNAAIPST